MLNYFNILILNLFSAIMISLKKKKYTNMVAIDHFIFIAFIAVSQMTNFDILTAGAGKGQPTVVVLDPNGRKDTVPAKITPAENDTFR